MRRTSSSALRLPPTLLERFRRLVSIVREVDLRKRRLSATFGRADQLSSLPDPSPLEADYARHLCVLISGYVERSLAEIILAYATGKTPAPLHSYLESSLRRLTNVDKERLLAVVGSLDAGWRAELDAFVIDERLAALNSIVGLKNDIAHGGGASVSLDQVKKYWAAIQEVIDKVEHLVCAPPRSRSTSAKRR